MNHQNASHNGFHLSLPDWLTVSRIILTPVILITLPISSILTLVIFVIAALTDLFDGFLARRMNQVTDVGKLLDPIADKLLVILPLIIMIPTGRVSAGMVAVIVARELIVCGMRMAASAQGVTIAAGWSGKVKTVSQMVLVGWAILFPVADWYAIAVAAWTVMSLSEYLGDFGRVFSRAKYTHT